MIILCAPKAKRDFCHSLGITEEFFDNVVEKYVNKDAVDKDIDGNWKRKDLFLTVGNDKRRFATAH